MIAPAPIVDIATKLAGVPMTISCERNSRFRHGLQAWAEWDFEGPPGVIASGKIHMPVRTCDRLGRLYAVRDARRVPVSHAGEVSLFPVDADVDDGIAVETLLHESLHVREGSGDESRVECDAHENKWQAVRLFHLAAWKANRVLRGMDIAHEGTPPSYRRDC